MNAVAAPVHDDADLLDVYSRTVTGVAEAAAAAVVAIQAGPQFIQGLRNDGITLFGAGVIVAIVPMLFALLIGKYLFKMHPGILLGACAGSRASSVALSVIEDAANSRVPALGFTVCFAVSNTLLTIGGVVIVLLLP